MKKRLSKRLVALTLSLLMSTAIIAGCGATQSNDSVTSDSTTPAVSSSNETTNSEAKNVVFWYWAETWNKVWDSYVKETNANIKVEYVNVAADDYMTKLQSTVASGGDLPDIGAMENGWRGACIQMDVWDNLEAAPYNVNRNDFVPAYLKLAVDTKGVIKGIENGPSPAGLAFHRDLAKKYFGTDDPAQLEAMMPDWDSFYNKGLEVKQKSGGTVFMMSGIGDLFTVLSGQGDSPYVDLKSGLLTIRKAAQSNFDILEKFRKAEIVDLIEAWTPAWNASYAAGTTIFYPFTHWSGPYAVEPNDPKGSGNWALMNAPGGTFTYGGTNFGIMKTSKVKEEAWAMIKWAIFSPDGSETMFKTWGNTLSANKNVSSGEKYRELTDSEFPYYNNQKVLNKLESMMGTMKIRELTPYDQTFTNSLNIGVKAINGGESSKTAMDWVVKEIIRNVPELHE